MTLDEKVEKEATRMLEGRISDMKTILREILLEQDRDTRHACADAVLDLDCDAYARCISCKTFD